MQDKREHLKALGFELVVDAFTVFVLMLAYKYTYDTLASSQANNKMDFIRNAFVFLAPSSIEGCRIIVAEGRENKKWDIIELFLSVLSIIVSGALMLQCILEWDMFTDWYIFLITIYPIRVVMSVFFEFLNLAKERSVKK